MRSCDVHCVTAGEFVLNFLFANFIGNLNSLKMVMTGFDSLMFYF